MDRFIDKFSMGFEDDFDILKSNMDRFIESENPDAIILFRVLKSNMDRFIVVEIGYKILTVERFKIQYG